MFDVTWPGMLPLTFIYQVICVDLSAMAMLSGNWCWCTDTDKETHLTACCLEMPLYMPRSVNDDHIYLNTKICCMCGCVELTSSKFGHIGTIGVSAPTLIRNPTSVPSDGSNTKNAHIYWFWALCCMLTLYFPHNLGPSIMKLYTDHIFCINYHIHLSCPCVIC